MSNMARPNPFAEHTAGYVVARTPLLPVDLFLAWTNRSRTLPAAARRTELRAALRELAQMPTFLEALSVASDSLLESLPIWMAAPESPRGQKIERALLSYFIRGTCRPTPFALFAGWATGGVAAQTRLWLGGLAQIRRSSRPSSRWLFRFSAQLLRRDLLRERVLLSPNSSLLVLPDRLKLATRRDRSADVPSFALVSIERSSYLDRALDRAQGGATTSELVTTICDECPDVSAEEAAAFVSELVDEQILAHDLVPGVTGPEPAEALRARLLDAGPEGAALHDTLSSICDELQRQDGHAPGARPEGYRAIQARLRDLGEPDGADDERAPADDRHEEGLAAHGALKVDMFRPAAEITLPATVLAEIKHAAAVLHQLVPRSDPMRPLRERFVERYGSREVPLLEALDDELGMTDAEPKDEIPAVLLGLDLNPRRSPATNDAVVDDR
jgi:hypothetical protein